MTCCGTRKVMGKLVLYSLRKNILQKTQIKYSYLIRKYHDRNRKQTVQDIMMYYHESQTIMIIRFVDESR